MLVTMVLMERVAASCCFMTNVTGTLSVNVILFAFFAIQKFRKLFLLFFAMNILNFVEFLLSFI